MSNILADPSSGFNAVMGSLCDTYNIEPFTIDFGPASRNFFQGWYGPTVLDETSNVKYPVMCLYTVKSQNTNQEKFRLFSGSVMMGLDVYLTFRKSSAPQDTETLGDAVESTMYTVFDGDTAYGDVLYNGDLLIQKGPLQLGASNWIQLVSSKLTFDLNI